nr:Chain C, Region from C-C chemokine receptor type 5 N-terminal domain [Homo sapiens]7NW3_A Chain A, Region from C-C chemokine receptor type 5 N-terminal domain [Homo sapiens]
PIYDIN